MGGNDGDDGQGSSDATHLHYELYGLGDSDFPGATPEKPIWNTSSQGYIIPPTDTSDPMIVLSPELYDTTEVQNPGNQVPLGPADI